MSHAIEPTLTVPYRNASRTAYPLNIAEFYSLYDLVGRA